MIIVCCVCHANMGEKEPLDDHSITHTYCKACAEEALRVLTSRRATEREQKKEEWGVKIALDNNKSLL